ncbi:MAG: L-2-amino-thiazoline-4-carboxylic acid hydrolase [Solobacterium sp.]|nr:L-2-amino-thiazoline-4-carboxylic acid hydrolase [Solobacterium sp.]
MKGRSILAMMLMTEISFLAVCASQLMGDEIKRKQSGSNLDRNRYFSSFRLMLRSQFGKAEGERIWDEAGKEYDRLMTEIEDEKSRKEIIIPGAALYKAIEASHPNEAVYMLKAYGASYGIRIAEAVSRMTKVPGVPELIWSNINRIIDRASSEKAGYVRRLVGDENGRIGVDILVCPYLELAGKTGVPQACLPLCAMDREYMKGFRHIKYTRTKSLAEGDGYCNYRLRYDASKK